MSFDWIEGLSIFCIGQCVFLLLVYVFKDSRKSLTSYLIMALLLIYSFDLVHDLLVYSRRMLQFPYLVGWASLFTYLKGPIIFFLVKSTLDANFQFKKWDLLHLGVFIYKNLENAWTEWNRTLDWKLDFLTRYYQNIDQGLPTIPEAAIGLQDVWLLHPIIYLALALFLLFKKWKGSGKSSSWFKLFVVSYALLYVINVAMYLSASYFALANEYYWGYSSLQFALLIIFISYVGLSPNFYASSAPGSLFKKAPLLDAASSTRLIQEVDAYIQTNRSFLEKKLSVDLLSQQMKVPVNHLSYVVNKERQLNFQDYINQFRVSEAIRLMNEGYMDQYTLDTLATESGFGSSTSFYRAFKKVTQQTPSEYLKSS